jgi:hypothetical protein
MDIVGGGKQAEVKDLCQTQGIADAKLPVEVEISG